MPVYFYDPPGTIRRRPLAPHGLTERLTSQGDMPVLAHFGIPRMSVADWHLAITGLVECPLLLRYGDLQRLPRRSLEACFECAGNPLEPTRPQRRVANVRWSGVPLRHVLEAAVPRAGAQYLWSFGVDGGTFAGHSGRYGKDLPLAKALEADVLLADMVNDERLSPEHGFPVRLVVPGYYGTNSVKWLSRLHVSDQRLAGLFTTLLYADPAGDGPERRPVWALAPESVIVSPAEGQRLRAGHALEIFGWAWSDAPVVRVEISDDDGLTWGRAAVGVRRDYGWQRFSTTWTAPSGRYALLSRAVIAGGTTQPRTGARNAIHTVHVEVI